MKLSLSTTYGSERQAPLLTDPERARLALLQEPLALLVDLFGELPTTRDLQAPQEESKPS